VAQVLSPTSLARSKDTRVFLDSHRNNVQWWSPRNEKAQRCIDFLSGRHWTDEEKEMARKKNKNLVVYNFLKPAERTIIGNFLNSKWDLKWIPWGGKSDDKLVAGLEALRIREAQQQKDSILDAETYSLGWASALAYQEVAVDYAPGLLPRMRTENRNRFSVYPDPNSRDVVTRDDAKFIDIVGWYSIEDLCIAFPERKEWLMDKARDRNESYDRQTDSYQQFNISTDRGHETQNYRNGLYKVVERYYRVSREYLDPSLRGPSISPVTGRPYCPPGIPHAEELWYAVAVEDFGTGEFVYNGRYHFQPINPTTGKVVWTILEYCFEAVNGEAQGGVEFDMDPAKAFDALMSNLLHSAKHASSQSIFLDRAAFATEKDFNDAAKYHADADRAFPVKEGRALNAAAPVPHSQVSQDVYSGIDYAKKAQDELSAAPPALQGMREGNQSGILHSQLVTQSETQLAHSRANYEKFLERKYLLRYIIWRQFYPHEMVVEIVEPTPEQRMSGETQVVMNQRVPKTDGYGFEIPGEVDILNDIDAMLYDIAITQSSRSASQRTKTLDQLSEISQSPALAADPGLASIVLEAQIELSDLDPKYKDLITQRRSQMDQNEQAQNQALAAEAQATQMKGQSAQAAAQAQVLVSQATAQKMQSDTQLKAQELQLKAGESSQKGQVEQAKIQQASQSMQMEQQGKLLDLDAQQKQIAADERMAQMDLMLKQMDLKMKEMEITMAKQDRLREEFAPVE